MSTPVAKRRRLNDSVSALHKPFRSPLRTAQVGPSATKSKTPSKLNHDSNSTRKSPTTRTSPCEEDPKIARDLHHISGLQEKHGQTHSPAEHKPDPSKARDEIPESEDEEGASPLSLVSPAAGPSNPNTSRSSLLHLAELKDQIALLRTHPAITPPEPLEELIRTWRRAARDAAEVLFPSVKDRVDAAGGMKTLRSAAGGCIGQNGDRGSGEQGRRDRFEELWAEKTQGLAGDLRRGGSSAGVDGCEQGEEEEAMREAAWREVDRREKEDEERLGREQDEDEEHAEFTMGMMLRGMNIDFDRIGWDESEAEWRD